MPSSYHNLDEDVGWGVAIFDGTDEVLNSAVIVGGKQDVPLLESVQRTRRAVLWKQVAELPGFD